MAGLEALSRGTDEVQQCAFPNEVVHLWHAAAIAAPARALDWWEGPGYLGKLLRRAGSPSALIAAWVHLPSAPALRRLNPESPLGRRLLRILPEGALLKMWERTWEAPSEERSLDPEEWLEAWQSADLRGRRLRREVPMEALVPVWEEFVEEAPLEAFGLLEAEHRLGRGLRTSLGEAGIVQAWRQSATWAPYWAFDVLHDTRAKPVQVLRRHLTVQQDILPSWRHLVVQFPLGALEHYVTPDPPGPELRSVVPPEEAVALWRSTPEPWLGAILLEAAPPQVLAAFERTDFLPLFESPVTKCRLAALRWLGQVDGGLSRAPCASRGRASER